MKEEEFCYRCGEKLIIEELDYIPLYMKLIGGKEYDPKTGERNLTVARVKCPNFTWNIFRPTHRNYTSMKIV